MSENETEVGKAELIEAAKRSFEALVANAIEGATGDKIAYKQQLTQEYGRYLWRAVNNGDAVARENLDDLKAQAMLIAVKRGLVIAHDARERLMQIVEIAAKFGIGLLLAAV